MPTTHPPQSPAGDSPPVPVARYGRRHVLAAAGVSAVAASVASAPLSPLSASAAPVTRRKAVRRATATAIRRRTPTATATASPTATPKPSLTAPRLTAGGPVVAPPILLTPPAVVAANLTLPNLAGTDPVWHLLRRATFGPTPQLVADVRAIGPTAWLDQQLAPAAIDDSACDAYLTRYPTLGKTTPQIRAMTAQYSWDAMYDLIRGTLARALWSKRQLFEVMIEFWSNHFNIATPTGEVWDLKPVDDWKIIRRNALGRFADLLQASAKSPAMLRYLDNDDSSVDTLNENYGRELLELHTVGVDAGYDHAMVVDSARLLTGYTIGRHGEFAYYNDWRYIGPVTVLGFTHPNTDDFDGLHVAEKYLDYLAHHPATARRIATKLARRFVSDDPPASLVTTLTSVYLSSDTAIAPVLRALFGSPEFAASIGQKARRPLDDVIATARTLGTAPAAGDHSSLGSLQWLLGGMGQALLAWVPPDGYPDTTEAWMSTVGTLGRWNAHIGLVQNWWKDGMSTATPAAALGAAPAATCGALVDQVSLRLLGIRLSAAQRAALLAFLPATETTSSADTVRWRLDLLFALVLDSPNWIAR